MSKNLSRLERYAVVTSLFLLIVSFTPPYVGAQENQAGPILARDWWDPEWRFRRPLLVTNNLEIPQENIPIFVHIEVEKGSILNAIEELRILKGIIEIPSYIIHETVDDDGFIVGVQVLFVTSLESRERLEVNLYYGNPLAEVPEYRSATTPDLELENEDSFSISFDPSEQNFDISFGGQYQDTLSFILSDATNTYSSSRLDASRFDLVSEWEFIGDLSNSSLEAGRLKLQGASLLLVMTAVWGENMMWISVIVSNVGSSGTGLTELTSVFDVSQFINLGFVESDYDLRTNSFQVGSAGSWFTIASSNPLRLYDVVDAEKAFAIAQLGNFSRNSRATEDVAFVSRINMGFLDPKEQVEQRWTLSVAGSRDDAISSAITSQGATATLVLQLQVLDTPIPRASMVYRSTLSILNSSFDSGFLVEVDTDDSKILPAWSILNGRLSYSLPDLAGSSFDRGNGFWTSEAEESLGVVYSSTSHPSADRGRIGRLWAIVSEEGGSANASLVSDPLIFDRVSSVIMNFSYFTSYLPGTNATGHVAINLDYNSDLIPDDTILFPIRGLNSSVTANATRYLEPDALMAWNYVALDLTEKVSTGRTTVWIEADLNVYQGFVELNLDDFAFEVTNPATSTMRILPSDSGFELVWTGNEKVASISGDLEIELQVVINREFSGGPNAEFDVEFNPPELRILEPSLPAEILTFPHRALIHVSRPSSIDEISVNERLVDTSESIRISGLVVLDPAVLEGLSHLIQVRYIFGILRIETRDVAGLDASDIILEVRDSFGRSITSAESGVDGKATLLLAPAEYQIELFYHDISLGSRSVIVRSDVTITAEIPIYQISFRVLDQLGLPIDDATLSLFIEELKVNEFLTSQDGEANFQMVGETNYRVSIDYLGQVIYDSEIRANIYGTTLVLQTDTVPFWLNYLIGLVLILPIGLIVLYFRGRGA